MRRQMQGVRSKIRIFAFFTVAMFSMPSLADVCIFFVFFSIHSLGALASEARLITDSAQKHIDHLAWNEVTFEVIAPEKKGGLPGVHLRGSYRHSNWNLIADSKPLINARKNETNFDFWVLLTGPKTSFEILAVDPKGKVERETFVVLVDDWPALLKSLDVNFAKRWKLYAGASLSHVELTQSRIASFSEDAVTVNGSYETLLFPPYWSLNASAFFTVLPFGMNLSSYDARFLDLNLAVGYKLPVVSTPWEVQILGGAYYSTMFVTNNAFGYQNESGPQLHPIVRRHFENGDSVNAYLKYSLAVGSGNSLSTENHELGMGLGWSHRLMNQHFVSVTLDWAQVHLVSQAISSELRCTSLSLGAGYSF